VTAAGNPGVGYGFSVRRQARAIAGLALANAAALAIGVVAAPAIARLFSPDEYGRFASYAASVAWLSTLATGRFEQAVFSVRGRARRLDFAALALMVALLLATLLVVAGLAAAAFGVVSPGHLRAFLVVVVGMLAAASLLVLVAVHVAQEGHAACAEARVAQGAIQNAAQVALGAVGARTSGALVVGFLAGQAGAVGRLARGVGMRIVRRLGPWRWPRLWQFARTHRSFPARSWPAAMLTAASIHAPIVVVTLGAGQAVAGELAMAQRLVTAPLLVLGLAIGQVSVGAASRLASGSRRDLRALLGLGLRRLVPIGLLATGLVVGGIVVVAPPVLGRDWSGVARFALLLAPFAFGQFVAAPLLGMFQVLRRQDLEFKASVARLAGLAPLVGLFLAPEAVIQAVLAYSILTSAAYAGAMLALRRAVEQAAAVPVGAR
jgi:O-antigen/teichoic acid export membrane protein